MKFDTVLVLDFGGQYCHLIGRRVRENNVYSEIVPHDISAKGVEKLREKFNVKGLILSGGPLSVYEKDAPRLNPEILELGLPVLGLCYGHQLLAYMMEGVVKRGDKKEFGITYATVDAADDILEGLGRQEKVWMSHSDTVFSLQREYETLAHTENCPVAAFRHKRKPIYGVQWHPEVVHTEHGMKILQNFLFKVCKCQPNWTMEDFIERAITETKQQINNKKAIIALSGGIDSSTATAITAKAVGKNLTAVFVDHGFMRQGEPEFVQKTFQKLPINFTAVNARKRFLEKLHGIIDPERKRKIIGEEFIRVFEEIARKEGADFLVQGTIYPDRIESGFRKFSDKIKTHHNVAGLPTKMEFKGIVD
jgi:GMP synthase (glutamine-hydrolysing)